MPKVRLSELVKHMKKYLTHKDMCPAGYRYSCICGHMSTQHFDYRKDCAHCKCQKFTIGECSCGLDTLAAQFRS
jgi:hypothetical protein